MNHTRTRMIGALAGLLLWMCGAGRDAGAEGNVRNGLSSLAYRRNALTTNRAALQRLTTQPLADALVTDAYLARQLHQDRARAMMTEIVRCALDENAAIHYTDPLAPGPTPTQHTWHGELGLCAGGTAGDWGAAAPTEACLQLVTACVTSRVNALGMSVPMAMRGPGVLPADAAIVTGQRYREAVTGYNPALGILIGSFVDTGCPAGAECGWRSGRVGTCTPGATVTMVVDGPECAATPIRACTGLHGCLGDASGWSGTPHDIDVDYAEMIDEQASACAPAGLTFACPETGMYSVMVGPRPPGASGAPAPLVEVAGTGEYPAPETDVFRFREGAFFGNMFEPGALTRECVVTTTDPEHVTCVAIEPTTGNTCAPTAVAGVGCAEADPAVPYRHVYACFTAAQQLGAYDEQFGAAYVNDRICDVPDADYKCFPHAPTRCAYPDPYGQQHGAHCGFNASLGIVVNCPGGDAGDATTLYRPITTYLADACDLLGDVDLCGRIRATSVAELGGGVTGAGRAPGSGSDADADADAGAEEVDSAGCATCRRGGGVTAVILAVVIVVLRRRRRRAAR